MTMGNQNGTNTLARTLQEVIVESVVKSVLLRSSLPCFLEMSSQISCIYLGDRVTASNLKSFLMDLA